jgi:hypothetical protein
MLRYFFTVLHGHKSTLKNEGLDLPDNDAAWGEATTAWSMWVKDEMGTDLHVLEFKTGSLER